MKVYNTLTRQKEDLIPITPGEYKIYACGPTVYNYIHIGNARPICVFDVLRRYLEYRGNKVTFVQNFTDIDDKIINRANEEGVSFSEISEKYIAEYKTDAAGLNVREATVHPKATENIDEIIAIIETLIEKGYAYQAEHDVYFSPAKFAEYGKLSHQPLEDLMSGARINVGEIKREPMDFALWKGSKPGEPYWESPWGQGRPGWHIECSAMNRKYLGETIDIHCGGQDLIFPHHENEIAQSECCNGAPFAHYWMHNGFITVDNEKMSKSKGNFFNVRDITKEYDPEAVRFFMLSAQYRSPFNFSRDLIAQASSSLERMYTARNNALFELAHAPERPETEDEKAFEERCAGYLDSFDNRMCDDLNTADAIGVIFELVRDLNTLTSSSPCRAALQKGLDTLAVMTDVLGLLRREYDPTPEPVRALVEQRTAAKKAKDFALADSIREKILEMGYVVEDTPKGPKVRKA